MGGYATGLEDERMLSYGTPKDGGPSGSTAAPAPGGEGVVVIPSDAVLAYVKATWADCRPWTEFYSTRDLSVPQFAAVSERVSSNVHVFRANYQVLAAAWLAVSVLFCIPSFLVASLCFFLMERWASRRASRNSGSLAHKDRILLAFTTLLVIWITGIGAVIVISLSLTAFTVTLHTALHTPDVEETEIATV